MASTKDETGEGASENQVERVESGSDADTDELLTNADLLCSGASDKQK